MSIALSPVVASASPISRASESVGRLRDVQVLGTLGSLAPLLPDVSPICEAECSRGSMTALNSISLESCVALFDDRVYGGTSTIVRASWVEIARARARSAASRRLDRHHSSTRTCSTPLDEWMDLAVWAMLLTLTCTLPGKLRSPMRRCCGGDGG